jgi:hypothetical protein
MKVFLGWSGTRSKKTAEVFGDWLGQVIQAIDPWISSDILKGARWSEEIADKLEEAKVGIICLTKENLNENWILFEAGALSKTKDAHVCTFLLDLKPTDIKQPLALFQHTEFEKEDVRKLTHTINQAVEDAGERSLDVKRLDTIFNRFWPDLEEKLKEIETIQSEVREPIRTEREILEEILETVRKQERRPLERKHTLTEFLQTSLSDEVQELISIMSRISLELDELNEKGLRTDEDFDAIRIRDIVEDVRFVLETRGGLLTKKQLATYRAIVEKTLDEMRQLRLKCESISTSDNNGESIRDL